MKNFTVYKLVFPNGKLYFGITTDFRKRMREHKHSGVSVSGPRPIKNAIKKYGWGSVTQIVLAEDFSEERAYEMECKLIKKHRTQDFSVGYNLADGGRTNIGTRYSVSYKKGIKLSKKHIQALIDSKKDKSYTDICKANATIYPVYAYSHKTKITKLFDSATECSKYLEVSPSNVYQHIYRNSKFLIKEWTVRRTLNQKAG